MKKDLRLNDIPKHNVHQVPDGYFDRLPTRIMERTAGREQVADTPWYAQLWRPVRYAVVPLVLLLLLMGVYFFNIQQEQAQQPIVTVASLSDDEIINYLDVYAEVDASDFEEYSIADQELAVDFLNVSSNTAEEELEYYQLHNLDY
ncbi:hypothetical protein ACFS7Z_22405 [Pontibacter toksunensis]|uniref:Uncharacterized protein n=1 Tax=Pontibacter toksunensis TaxID=1332631 RepID=A0ABW6C1I8_9BACT